MEESQASVTQPAINVIELASGVQRVNLLRWSTGQLEVELSTIYSSRGNQPDVSWNVVTLIAEVFSALGPGQRFNLTGSEDFVFSLTTYSDNGDYRYYSETNYETFVRLNNRSISYNEWIEASVAGFR